MLYRDGVICAKADQALGGFCSDDEFVSWCLTCDQDKTWELLQEVSMGMGQDWEMSRPCITAAHYKNAFLCHIPAPHATWCRRKMRLWKLSAWDKIVPEGCERYWN